MQLERVIDDVMHLLKLLKRNRRRENGSRPMWAMFPFRPHVEEGVTEHLEEKNCGRAPPSTEKSMVINFNRD